MLSRYLELIRLFKICCQNAIFRTRNVTINEKQIYLISGLVYSVLTLDSHIVWLIGRAWMLLQHNYVTELF